MKNIVIGVIFLPSFIIYLEIYLLEFTLPKQKIKLTNKQMILHHIKIELYSIYPSIVTSFILLLILRIKIVKFDKLTQLTSYNKYVCKYINNINQPYFLLTDFKEILNVLVTYKLYINVNNFSW